MTLYDVVTMLALATNLDTCIVLSYTSPRDSNITIPTTCNEKLAGESGNMHIYPTCTDLELHFKCLMHFLHGDIISPQLCRWLQVVLLEPHNTNALLNLAQVYYNLEHHWKTVEVLQRILKLAPLHKGALHLLGHVYYRMERYSETVTVLERLIQEDPEYSDATTLLNMAQRHILQER